MTIESATYIADLNAALPAGTDDRSEGDDHLKLIKATVQATFPGLAGRYGRIQSKATNYGAALNDSNSVIHFSVAATLSFAAAATLGNGWSCFVRAGGGNVTLDPNASETIEGATTLVLPRGGWMLVICDGTKFFAQILGELPGTLKDMAANILAPGYLACDGAAVSRTTYADLFAIIGTTWGAGDGSTTFNVPNLARRVTVGSGGSGTGTLANTVGATGGAETHALTSGELAAHTHTTPNHTHTVNDPGHDHSASSGNGSPHADTPVGGSGPTAYGFQTTGTSTTGITIASSGGGTSGSTGSGTAHNNMQPSAVVRKMIKF